MSNLTHSANSCLINRLAKCFGINAVCFAGDLANWIPVDLKIVGTTSLNFAVKGAPGQFQMAETKAYFSGRWIIRDSVSLGIMRFSVWHLCSASGRVHET